MRSTSIPRFSPSGDRIAFVSDRGGRRGIWVVTADGGAPRLIGSADVLDALTWSPDGKRIVFSRPTEKLAQLVAMSVENGSVEPLGVPAAGHAPSWSSATDRLAYLELEAATAKTPSRTSLAILAGRDHRVFPVPASLQGFANGMLAWSRDGRRLAVVALQANTRASIWIADPDATEPLRRLVELPLPWWVRGITWTPDGSSIVIAQRESKSDIVLFELSK